MAVTSVTSIPEAAEGGWDQLWRRTYARGYRVECGNRYDNEVTIRTALDGSGIPLLPRIGNAFRDYHPWITGGAVSTTTVVDAGSFVVGVKYKRTHGNAGTASATWEVACDYGPYDASVFPQNPIDWPTKLQFASQQFDRVIWRDQAGNAILNSAGDRFADAITIDDSRPVITVTRNVLASAFDLTMPDTYRDMTNSLTWNGFSPKVVKCNSITSSETQYDSNGGVYYFTITFVFELNRDTWHKTILDQGFTDISLITGKRLKINDASGQPLSDPALLNGAGHRLAVAGTPVFLNYDVYPSVDFGPLGIDFAATLGRS